MSAQPPNGAGNPNGAASSVEQARPKILVVNDSPEFLAMMREVLDGEGGYEVATLDQSEGVVRQASSDLPDLIIIDIVFRQGPTGLSVAEELAAAAATRDIPVLFCTALSRRDILAEVWELVQSRNQRVLFKPFDLDDLLTVVAEMLARKVTGDR
jgi:CheY-like chemotaxis protein